MVALNWASVMERLLPLMMRASTAAYRYTLEAKSALIQPRAVSWARCSLQNAACENQRGIPWGEPRGFPYPDHTILTTPRRLFRAGAPGRGEGVSRDLRPWGRGCRQSPAAHTASVRRHVPLRGDTGHRVGHDQTG